MAGFLALLLYAGFLAGVRKPADGPCHVAVKAAYLKVVAAHRSVPDGAARPNILLILDDDLCLDDFGFFGGTAIATPNIDALARDRAC